MTAKSNNFNDRSIPLFVDLDGTLVKTDLLFESLLALLKLNPMYIFLIPIWLLRGKAHLKQQIAERVEIDPSLLPYHSTFLKYLHNEAESGRTLVLATATNRKLAQMVVHHLGFFNNILASDEKINLSGESKLKAILDECGESQFDYAANAKIDLNIFLHAREVILVNPARKLEKTARKVSQVQQVFEERKTGVRPYLKAMRIYQWMKNLLLFLPLFTSHEWFNKPLVIDALLGFFAFSLCASSMYLVNDLLDLPSDRSHPNKKVRPFAIGDIPILSGCILLTLLLVMGLGIATILSIDFMVVLLVYLVVTFFYSLYLKTYMLIDVLVLACLYTIRVIAGSVVIEVILSFWLLAFSMFIFFSLALVKRCSELITLAENNRESAKGRDYRVSDLGYLQSMGIASGYLSVLIIAFFINSQDVAASYNYPKLLWLSCPAILYWVSRIWLKTGRGEMHDDPLIFSIRDRGSQGVALAILIVVILAI